MDERGRIGLITLLVLISLFAVFVLAAKPPRFSCSDTDGGWNAFVKGTASGYSYGVYYNNTDYCNGDTTLLEYYCDNTRVRSENYICGLNESRVCFDGACVTTTTTTLPPNSCSDSDGGQDVLVLGTVSGYYNGNPYSNTDYCRANDTYLKEFYCSSVYQYSHAYYCENITGGPCVNGICTTTTTSTLPPTTTTTLPPTTTTTTIGNSCSDSDGGWNGIVQGTTSGYYNGQPYSHTEYCIDNTTVMEYYCSFNLYENNDPFDCIGNLTGNCSNGACV